MKPFEINFLDHVAIRVKDMEESIQWYEKILGLQKYQLEAWGDFPVFMLSGQTGVAIFPANLGDDVMPVSKHVKIDHFAFNVSQAAFQKAQAYFDEVGEGYEFQDHHYFHSIYLKDPDNHTVELTTLVVSEEAFFGKKNKA